MYKLVLKVPAACPWMDRETIVSSLSVWMRGSIFTVVPRTASSQRWEWEDTGKPGLDFDGRGIGVTSRTAKDHVVYTVEFGKVMLHAHETDPVTGRRSRNLRHDHWITFNTEVNAWLDMLSAQYGISSDAKSSSYVVRDRNRARHTFTPGNYHGIGDEWTVAP